MLDFVKADYVDLQKSLNPSDRLKLDEHLEALRAYESELQASTCEAPDEPTGESADYYERLENFPLVGRQQMAMLKIALLCDMTRVASLPWSYARSLASAPRVGVSASVHGLSHNPDSESAREGCRKVNTFYAEQLAELIASLKVPDPMGEGRLLDNTIVYWCSEVALGGNHSYKNMRCVIAGNGQGALKTGQHLKLEGDPAHNLLMVTFLQAMGIETDTFGTTEYGTGPLTGLG